MLRSVHWVSSLFGTKTTGCEPVKPGEISKIHKHFSSNSETWMTSSKKSPEQSLCKDYKYVNIYE